MPPRSKAVFAVSKADNSLPTKDVIKDCQAVLMSRKGVETAMRSSRRGRDENYHILSSVEPLLWISPEAKYF